MDNSKKFGIAGFVVGGLLAFFMRPSAFLVGQLSFSQVISRGANLQGIDAILVPIAKQSFNVMISGAIIGALIGIGIGYYSGRRNVI